MSCKVCGLRGCLTGQRITAPGIERAAIAAFLRAPNADGTPCSADREVLAQRVERGEHWS